MRIILFSIESLINFNMSKRIFINNLNSYVSQAIFKEFRNDTTEDGEPNDDANMIFATYIDKDSSDKPDGIKKMLKVLSIQNFYLSVMINEIFIEV